MSDPFAHLIPDARAFLVKLSANNTRDWFAGQKERYQRDLKSPALLFLDQVAHDLGRQTGQTLRPKLFRPHRDVRFSKDKTPYHTHLHMLWTISAGENAVAGQSPALFLGIAPQYVRLGGGIMGFDKDSLTRWRAAVDGAFGDEIQGILDDLARQALVPDAPELKRVPAPFDKQHPNATLLRRKGMTLWRDLPVARFGEPQAAMADLFKALSPLLKGLQRAL